MSSSLTLGDKARAIKLTWALRPIGHLGLRGTSASFPFIGPLLHGRPRFHPFLSEMAMGLL